MLVEPFKIESISEADDYLQSLLSHPEYRTASEIEMRAAKYIEDAFLRTYFLNKAAELLNSVTRYRVAPGGSTPDGWVVVAEPTARDPHPAPVVVDLSMKEEAEAEAERRNAFEEEREA